MAGRTGTGRVSRICVHRCGSREGYAEPNLKDQANDRHTEAEDCHPVSYGSDNDVGRDPPGHPVSDRDPRLRRRP